MYWDDVQLDQNQLLRVRGHVSESDGGDGELLPPVKELSQGLDHSDGRISWSTVKTTLTSHSLSVERLQPGLRQRGLEGKHHAVSSVCNYYFHIQSKTKPSPQVSSDLKPQQTRRSSFVVYFIQREIMNCG